MNAKELIEKLMEYYDVHTLSDLSVKMDIGQPSISKWKSNNSINAIKKKCRELGIYGDIFGDQNSFTQYGKNSQQIGVQNNEDSSKINVLGNEDEKNEESKDVKIDNDILKLMEALNSVANALNKKEELKNELTNLISKLPTL